jgi:acyl-CoA thioesterase-1
VLVLGDSSFFGHGVREAETLPAQLEQALRARGVDARVQNFGVPGYSSIQSRALLDEQGWAADPDLVLIGSLWSDNNIDGFRDADLLAITARVNRALSLGIAEAPEQWFWQSRRFRHRPPGETPGPDGLPPLVAPVSDARRS